MACGGGSKKKIVLDKKDLVDIKIDLPGGGSLNFSKDTSSWRNNSKFPTNNPAGNSQSAQNPPEAKAEEKKPEIDISTNKIEPVVPYNPKDDEEALKKEKEELERKRADVITTIDAKKEELKKILVLLQEQEQNVKKNQKDYLISEIKNEILVNMTVKQNKKYEQVVKDITTNRV